MMLAGGLMQDNWVAGIGIAAALLASAVWNDI